MKKPVLSEKEVKEFERIIKNKEVANYIKVQTTLRGK
jgi:hypothetical protein